MQPSKDPVDEQNDREANERDRAEPRNRRLPTAASRQTPRSAAGLSRRGFLVASGALTATAAATATTGLASPAKTSSSEELAAQAADQCGVLFDSTLCVGCRSCELACNEENELGRSADDIFNGRLDQDARALGTDVFTYVTIHDAGGDPATVTFGKVQCMHCIEPACASSCPVQALEKTARGPVIWHPDLCLGCRYCMMACPFLVPRFEWDSRNPRIRKCEMCNHRLLAGKPPACVATCPTGALKFGVRAELLEEAHRRIRERPRRYVHHVYGEHEAGGTNFLHLAGRPFEELGYRSDLPNRSYREYTRPAMAAIPYVFNLLAVLLGVLAWAFNRRRNVTESAEEKGS